MKAIINADLVMYDHLIPDGVILIQDGKIAAFGEKKDVAIPEGCEILDAQGAYVGPGLVDIHVHTGDCYQFWKDPIPAAQYHLQHGVTTVLPTPYPRNSLEEYIQAGKNVRAAMAKPEGRSIAGIYAEGPYTNPNYGSNSKLNPWNKPVLAEDYEPMLEACGDITLVWGMAPERGEELIPFMLAARKANPNVRFAITHTEATPQQVEALMPYGLCISTHHTNATGPSNPAYDGTHVPKVDDAVNYYDSFYAEMISDSQGIHVKPFIQRLIRKVKGDDKVVLISDRTYTDAPNPPELAHITDLNFDQWGGISGSKLTLDVACWNYMKHTGASLVEAFRAGACNPARAVGLLDRGQIAVGLRADLIFVDHKMHVKTVLLCGDQVK